jgi:hypothetical protein
MRSRRSLALGHHVLACTRAPNARRLSTELDAQALARAGGDLLAKVLATRCR